MKHETKITFLCMAFSVLSIVCLLLSNILASKIVNVYGFHITAGAIVFPISFIVSDIITEVYGFRMARAVIWLGFSMNILMVIFFALAIALPSPSWADENAAFSQTLGSTPRFVLAGLAAYLLGSWANAVVLSKLKLRSKGGSKFGIRAVLSTLIGEGIDSIVFILFAFADSVPFESLIRMIAVQIVFKSTYECLVLPLTVLVVKKVKKCEGIDIYDEGVSYSMINVLK
jgi:uncharacterized integral membrane protein (TIGR00697 family)